MKKDQDKKKPYTIIKVDTSLDKYLEMGLFQHKIDKANEMVKTVGLPKATKK